METMLVLNGFELSASVDDGESTIISLAAGTLSRAEFTAWVKEHARPMNANRGA